MNNQQYQQFKKIAIKICNNDKNTEDLLHDIIIQLRNNKTYNTLSDKEQVFFFVRALKNQYRSNNSSYHRQYRKYEFDEIPINYEMEDNEYEELPSIDWITETLDTELKLNKDMWYQIGIYKMYIEHKRLSILHRITKIPKYSIRMTLKEMNEWIKLKWEQYEK